MTDLNPVSLDAALRGLAADVAFPAVPDHMTAGVASRLAGRTPAPRRWRWTRALLIAAGLTLLAAATVAALAWALPGLRIVPVASVPAAPGLGSGLALGDAAAPGEAAPFTIAALGVPDATYRSPDGGVTTFLFAPRDGLPELGAGIGLLAQRIDGTLDRSMVMKLVDEVDARVVPVSVGGADGFWVAGPPHLVRYVGTDGRERAEMTRLAGDTLVWQDGDTLYRIESGLGLEPTLRLAESVDDGTGER